jgi:hypothetical protein
MNDFINTLTTSIVNSLALNISSEIASQSLYYQTEVGHGLPQSQSCIRWSSYLQNDVAVSSYTFSPVSMRFTSIAHDRSSSASPYGYIQMDRNCHDANRLEKIISYLASPETLSQTEFGREIHIPCSGYNWTVFSCSEAITRPPSICVGCDKPFHVVGFSM